MNNVIYSRSNLPINIGDRVTNVHRTIENRMDLYWDTAYIGIVVSIEYGLYPDIKIDCGREFLRSYPLQDIGHVDENNRLIVS